MSVLQTVAGFKSNSSGVDIGDNIANSLMLDSASSQYLSRTLNAPTTQAKWILVVDIKRGKTGSGAVYAIAGTGSGASDTTRFDIGFTTASPDTLVLQGGTTVFRRSSQLFRDTAKFGQLIISCDTTQGTEANKLLAYFNNEAVTWATTNAITTCGFNTAAVSTFGGANAANFWDGYFARRIFLDGKCLQDGSVATTDFGRVSADTGQWVSKTYAGSFAGANSDYLDFANSADLGNDVSGNNNDWTTNGGISSANQYTDTPTNSYAVLSPIDGTARGTISIGNTKSAISSAGDCTRGTLYPSTGKWYFEALITKPAGAGYLGVGVVGAKQSQNNPTAIAQVASGVWSYRDDGYPMNNATNLAVTTTYATGDRVRVAFDADAGYLWWAVNGVWINSGNPSTGANPMYSNLSASTWGGFAFIVNHLGSSGGAAIINSGAQAFRGEYSSGTASSSGYTGTGNPPTGFSALCTANLPTPAIIKPALHFNAKTRTGTGATYSVTGELFAPDLVWTKGRSGATDHALYDSVRGVQKQLESNTTTAESTEATGLTAFNSDGYTAGALAQMNTNAATYIDWLFKGGGAAVSNTDGSITSSVSANTTAGMSIVTYTGTGTSATIGHGLGVVPKMYIIKGRNTTVAYGWFVYHTSLTSAAYRLELQSTAAQANGGSPGQFNSTAPTTSVFSIGNSSFPEVNENTKNYVALCFAEVEGFSKAFAYTGNLSTDGPFVYLGFKARWIILKSSTTAENWFLFDTARGTYNIIPVELYPNLSNAEGSDNKIDVDSNGFKVRTSSSTINASGATIIGFAIAEAPMKYATAR